MSSDYSSLGLQLPPVILDFHQVHIALQSTAEKKLETAISELDGKIAVLKKSIAEQKGSLNQASREAKHARKQWDSLFSRSPEICTRLYEKEKSQKNALKTAQGELKELIKTKTTLETMKNQAQRQTACTIVKWMEKALQQLGRPSKSPKGKIRAVLQEELSKTKKSIRQFNKILNESPLTIRIEGIKTHMTAPKGLKKSIENTNKAVKKLSALIGDPHTPLTDSGKIAKALEYTEQILSLQDQLSTQEKAKEKNETQWSASRGQLRKLQSEFDGRFLERYQVDPKRMHQTERQYRHIFDRYLDQLDSLHAETTKNSAESQASFKTKSEALVEAAKTGRQAFLDKLPLKQEIIREEIAKISPSTEEPKGVIPQVRLPLITRLSPAETMRARLVFLGEAHRAYQKERKADVEIGALIKGCLKEKIYTTDELGKLRAKIEQMRAGAESSKQAVTIRQEMVDLYAEVKEIVSTDIPDYPHYKKLIDGALKQCQQRLAGIFWENFGYSYSKAEKMAKNLENMKFMIETELSLLNKVFEGIEEAIAVKEQFDAWCGKVQGIELPQALRSRVDAVVQEGADPENWGIRNPWVLDEANAIINDEFMGGE